MFIKGRTFGHHFLKRISFAIIPAAFVVGMIFTLLAALTVVSIKSLGVGVRMIMQFKSSYLFTLINLQVILLVLTVGQLIAKNIPQAVPFTAYATAPAAPIHW